MSKKGKIFFSVFMAIVFIVIIVVLLYQYNQSNQEVDELSKENDSLTDQNEILNEEINSLENELNNTTETENEEVSAEDIKTQREELHKNIDLTIEQFLNARYVINDETKDKRYEMAEEVTTENALDQYFEEAIKSITSDTEINEYSNLEDYKSYVALEDVNTSRTFALASATQHSSSEEEGTENITNFLFEFELILDNGAWKVDEVNVKDISLYSD